MEYPEKQKLIPMKTNIKRIENKNGIPRQKVLPTETRANTYRNRTENL